MDFLFKMVILVLYTVIIWTRVRTRTRNIWTRKYPDPGLKLYRVFGRSSKQRNNRKSARIYGGKRPP